MLIRLLVECCCFLSEPHGKSFTVPSVVTYVRFKCTPTIVASLCASSVRSSLPGWDVLAILFHSILLRVEVFESLLGSHHSTVPACQLKYGILISHLCFSKVYHTNSLQSILIKSLYTQTTCCTARHEEKQLFCF